MAKIRYSRVFAWLVLCSIFFSVRSLAQNPSNYYEEEPRTFYGGLILGTNLCQVDGDNQAGYHKIGINAGGIMYARLDERLAASLELLYSQKGSHSNEPELFKSGTTTGKYNINLNYAEIPIQLNYFDRRKSHFGAGFSYSQLISQKEEVVSQPGIPADTLDNFKFRKSEIDFIIGGSLHIWKGIFLNLRFQYSVMPIRKNDSVYPELRTGRDQYSNVWTIRLMYLF